MISSNPIRKIRIFHTGDVHLDSPFSRLDSEQGEIRRRELRGVFTSMMLFARTQKADLVLISGDLFDVRYAGEDTVNLIVREFAKAPECRFVICAGNHDPYTARSVYKLKTFPDNVFVFDSPELSMFRFDDIGVDVYGWSFVSDSMHDNPLVGKAAEQSGNIPVLCCHCDITNADSEYAPVSVADIERFGAAYSALGHIHRHEGQKTLRSGAVYGYCGCPEGRSFDETGVGGAYLADVEMNADGSFYVRSEFVRFSLRTYEIEKIDMTGCLTFEEAEGRIKQRIKEKKYDDKTSLRLVLSGMTGVGCSSLDSITSDDLGVFSLQIKDKTTPTYDASVFESDMSIRGAFYRVLLPMLKSDDEQERERASEALRIGFAALDGSDVTR